MTNSVFHDFKYKAVELMFDSLYLYIFRSSAKNY